MVRVRGDGATTGRRTDIYHGGGEQLAINVKYNAEMARDGQQ